MKMRTNTPFDPDVVDLESLIQGWQEEIYDDRATVLSCIVEIVDYRPDLVRQACAAIALIITGGNLDALQENHLQIPG